MSSVYFRLALDVRNSCDGVGVAAGACVTRGVMKRGEDAPCGVSLGWGRLNMNFEAGV